MATRGITKKKLRQDALRNLIWRTLLWIEGHKRPLLIGGLGVLLFLGGGGIYLLSSLRAEQEAQRLLVNAHALLKQAGSPVSAEASKFEEPIKAYQGLLERFPRARTAEEAAISLGNLYYQLNRYDEAIATFKKSLKDHPGGTFAFSAGLGLGYAYEAKGNLEEAALAYEQAVARGSEDPLLPEGLLALARTYEALKKKEEAQKLYEKVMEEHPGWAKDARRHLTRLRVNYR